MQPLNGTFEPKANVNGVNTVHEKLADPQPKPAIKEPPAKTLVNGRILTRVWAELMVWGEIRWRVSQIRTGSEARGDGEYRSLHFNDLWDGIRGLYQAHRWIRRIERRRERRWFGRW